MFVSIPEEGNSSVYLNVDLIVKIILINEGPVVEIHMVDRSIKLNNFVTQEEAKKFIDKITSC